MPVRVWGQMDRTPGYTTVLDYGQADPGEGILFEDYSSGEPVILSVFCHELDLAGGFLFYRPEEVIQHSQDDRDTVFGVSSATEPFRARIFAPYKPASVDIIDEHENRLRILAKHVLGSES